MNLIQLAIFLVVPFKILVVVWGLLLYSYFLVPFLSIDHQNSFMWVSLDWQETREISSYCFFVSCLKLWIGIWEWSWLVALRVDLVEICFYDLREIVMGKPFWGRAKGPYWIPFCVPTIDHLQTQKQRNTHVSFWFSRRFYF